MGGEDLMFCLIPWLKGNLDGTWKGFHCSKNSEFNVDESFLAFVEMLSIPLYFSVRMVLLYICVKHFLYCLPTHSLCSWFLTF